jgi:hypothetical protein
MAELYHFYIAPNPPVDRQKIEAILNAASDWIRYDPKCYIVQTTTSPVVWQSRLQPLVGGAGHLFICKFEVRGFYGWMSADFWKWFEAKPGAQAATS